METTTPPPGPRRDAPSARGRWRDAARHRVTWQEVRRWAVVTLVVAVPALVVGVGTATADANLGPHAARYEVTYDGRAELDLGPLGRVLLDSPLPLGVGARVTVGALPRELTDLGTVSTLDQLGGDLDRYVQLFSAPRATLEVVVRALVADALRRAAALTALGLALVVLARAALGPRRRAELARTLRPAAPALAAGAAVGVLVLALATASGTTVPGRDLPGPPSRVFDGTPLEGAVITGRLAGIVDTYGGQVVDAYRDNEAFYADAAGAVRGAWQARLVAEERVVAVRERAGLATPRPDDASEPVVMVVVSDLHCNVGMAQVLRAVVDLADADVVLNAGDTTTNGTSVENYCVTAFAQAVPAGVRTVVADGNHDSPDTAAHERSVGWVVLDGATVEVAGVRILGDADPRATRVGVGTVLTGDETVPDVSARLADVACADPRGVDLLLVHDVGMGAQTLARGCARAQVSGHYHRRIGPEPYLQGVRYVSSSTAGAALGRPTVGPLNGVAELTVLRFDPRERRVVDYRLVRVSPDATATVSYAVPWPRVAQPPVLDPRPGEPV